MKKICKAGDDDIDTIFYNLMTLIQQIQIFYWEKF